MLKVKDKETILETARKKQLVTYKRVPIKLPADFSMDQKRLAGNIQNDEKQWSTTKITLLSKAIIQNQRTDKKPPDKTKLKEFIKIKPVL